VGNKRDMGSERVVPAEAANQLAQSIGIRYF
jgi:hypothetical protein